MLKPTAPTRAGGVPYGEDGYRLRENRGPEEVDAAALVTQGEGGYRFPWCYPELNMPLRCSVMVTGEPGRGKSTAATIMALHISQVELPARAIGAKVEGMVFPPVIYLSVEEAHEVSCQDRFSRAMKLLGAPARKFQNVKVGAIDTPDHAERYVEKKIAEAGGIPGLLIVDSLTDLEASESLVNWWIKGSGAGWGFIGVQHLTTSGSPKGGKEPNYGADVWLHAYEEGGKLMMGSKKSRYGAVQPFATLEPPQLVESNDDGDARVYEFTPGAPRESA